MMLFWAGKLVCMLCTMIETSQKAADKRQFGPDIWQVYPPHVVIGRAQISVKKS